MSDAETKFPPPGFEQQKVVHMECKRNHAASENLVCYDGCQEFLKASAENNTRDAMLCVVCGCHQSFHIQYALYTPKAKSPTRSTPKNISSPEGLVNGGNNPGKELMLVPVKPERKKRTVFTPNLKNQMTSFAENIGWTPKGVKKAEMEHFCLEVGISYKTFAVWLNNNRPRAMKKDAKPMN